MESQSYKLNLLFLDRIGIVADISRRLADRSMNILSMEVERRQQLADVYLAVAPVLQEMTAGEILETLSGLDGLQSIRFIKTMPNENRQNTFHTVLDNVSDGIVSIDAKGKITTINQLARTILNCHHRDLIGRRIDQLAAMDAHLLSCLEGKSYSRIRRSVSTNNGQFEFFTSARPIADSTGRIIGAVEIMKDMKEIKALVEEVSQPENVSFDAFVGNTPSVIQAISFARKIAPTPSIVSIRGQSGTGKELFARAIHAESGRTGAFIPVNCAAIPDALLESELFGYESGAFTGAQKSGRAGLFEQAGGGTLFLDEIADLPPGPQAKILRAIQEKRVRRIGGRSEIEVDARIITATNRNLERLVESGDFRQDLYYRINVLPIHLPPLNARTEDIRALADHFLFQINCRLGSDLQHLSSGALEKLVHHSWPGNVRELKNVIERAAILCDTKKIGVESILFSFDLAAPAPSGNRTAKPANDGGPLTLQLDALERRIVVNALKTARSIRQAAGRLGVSHTTLRNKIKKHRLPPLASLSRVK
ncbi:Fis family transcriptional regulator [Desulfosarcina alkanivorans]|uniref:HTH-type transcriptional regulatory protein TyrR n=1 Tax=Desulfosarcina alkanivorans TaxID=571177 RepID=A0A5K7YQG6_9BACT|nr:sigma 54-interacting transcriptional regulator [Desulfosarcina alkanivorans]BBO66847.1 Fis family transcriptional regulator [Desulfosarcina alkanivorans]